MKHYSYVPLEVEYVFKGDEHHETVDNLISIKTKYIVLEDGEVVGVIGFGVSKDYPDSPYITSVLEGDYEELVFNYDLK